MILRRRTAVYAAVLLFFACFLPACRQHPKSQTRLFRFIDGLDPRGVIDSPFLKGERKTSDETVYPISSTPATDASTGENPLGLKRKLSIGPTSFNLLFAPARSEYDYNVELPQNGVMEFGIGIIRDRNSETLGPGKRDDQAGVDFSVLLETGGRKKALFQKRLKLPPQRESRTLNFSQERIVLPAHSPKARITLLTAGSKDCFAFWANPILYDRGRKPANVILVSLDTLRADHLKTYGYDRETSPAIDSLGRDGTVFLNAYAPAPWTLPSHVSLLTSLNDVRHQVYLREQSLGPDLKTLADFLRSNGYYCAAVTGGAFVSPSFGFAKGFDSFDIAGAEMKAPDVAAQCFQSVDRWLDANADKGFFLFVHTYQLHSPYHSPPPYNTKFTGENAARSSFDVLEDLGGPMGVFKPLSEADRMNIIGLYDGEIRYTDESLIKPLVEKLVHMDLYDRTMLIVTSDHGEQFYEHGSWNHGNFLYGDVLKVPLIIKFPGGKFRGRNVPSIVRLIDVMPTVLQEMGTAFAESDLDGRSLLPVLEGKEKTDREFLSDVADMWIRASSSDEPQRIALNSQGLKVILNREYPKDYLAGLFAPPPPFQSVEAYDLSRDPLEKNNIASEKADLVRSLTAQVLDLYRNAKRMGTARTKSKEIEDQLRALGYIK